jgi:hypothetical protein
MFKTFASVILLFSWLSLQLFLQLFKLIHVKLYLFFPRVDVSKLLNDLFSIVKR